MKICVLCNESKNLEFFTTKSGNVTTRCKPCLSMLQAEWRKKNPEKMKKIKQREYQKNKDQCDKRNKEWVQKNKEGSRAIKAKYREKNRQLLREKGSEYIKRNLEDRAEYLRKKRKIEPEKYNARNIVNYAVKSGKLEKSTTCSVCQSEGRIEGHHPDYSKPLEVVWLCVICHREEHKRLKQEQVV